VEPEDEDPVTSSDERPVGWGDELPDDAADEASRILEERPPHWDAG